MKVHLHNSQLVGDRLLEMVNYMELVNDNLILILSLILLFCLVMLLVVWNGRNQR